MKAITRYSGQSVYLVLPDGRQIKMCVRYIPSRYANSTPRIKVAIHAPKDVLIATESQE